LRRPNAGDLTRSWTTTGMLAERSATWSWKP